MAEQLPKLCKDIPIEWLCKCGKALRWHCEAFHDKIWSGCLKPIIKENGKTDS